MNARDKTPLTKGKYAGQTPEDVADHDPCYLLWAYRTWTPAPCSPGLAAACEDACCEGERDD